MPNGVAKKFTAAWFGQVVDQVKNKRTLRYTLHLTQTYSSSTLFVQNTEYRITEYRIQGIQVEGMI